MAHTAELILDAKATLGEGPVWDADEHVLYWVDIEGKKVHVYDPASDTDRAIELQHRPGTVVKRRSGGLMIAIDNGFAALDPQTGAVEVWCEPESDKPENRFNDGKCDPAGRFWAGSMAHDAKTPSAALYCLDPDRTVRQVLDGVIVSNGIAWSEDAKTMYYIDTMTNKLEAFDYDIDTGEVANRRTVVEVPAGQGFLDGMTRDSQGRLWVAIWGASRVVCFDPQTGAQIDQVDVPASQSSACWFGGPDLDELYITSARTGLDDAALAKEPLAGGLFRARPGARGVPADQFAG